MQLIGKILHTAASVADNVSSVFIEPETFKNKWVKAGAWITTIAVGICTLGTVQAVSAIWKYLRLVCTTPTQQKATDAFKNTFHGSSSTYATDAPLLDDEDSIEQPNRVEASREAQNPLSLSEIAQSIYDGRDFLWQTASRQANGSDPMPFFMGKIRKEFEANNQSLSAIAEDSEALNTLLKSARLRKAVLIYAKANNLDNLLNKHLEYLVQDVFDKKEGYVRLSVQGLKEDHDYSLKVILNLTLLIRKRFKQEGRSLQEVINKPSLRDIFIKSKPLEAVLFIYSGMLARPSSDSVSPEVNDFNKQFKQEACRLAREDAQGEGLVTRLGLREIPEDKLKAEIKKKLRANHPDRNPEADPQIAQDLNQLLGLINNQQFELYRQRLETLRASASNS